MVLKRTSEFSFKESDDMNHKKQFIKSCQENQTENSFENDKLSVRGKKIQESLSSRGVP